MARSLRELSKACGVCGVEWNEDLSNKQFKRALCKGCYQIELDNRNKLFKEKRAEIGAAIKRIELYRDYKLQNRKAFWASINKEIKTLTKREDIRAFISKQMDRILADDNLMKYISAMSIAEQRKNETHKYE
jgi:hypothetical protein